MFRTILIAMAALLVTGEAMAQTANAGAAAGSVSSVNANTQAGAIAGGNTTTIGGGKGSKMHNSAPSLALGSAVANGGFYNGAVRNACAGSRGQGWMAGLTGGADNGSVTGGGLGFGRSTTEESLVIQCEIGEQATELMKVGMTDAAQKMQCMSVFKRQTLDAMDPSFCADIPVVGASFARFEDTQLIQTVSHVPAIQAKRAASFVPQPVVEPKPTGNAVMGEDGMLRCLDGFVDGSCGRKVTYASELRQDG